MNRRSLLTTTMLVAPVLAVAACSGTLIQQAATDANLVANAASTIVTTAESLMPASAQATLAKIEGYATTIGKDATTLGGTLVSITGSPAQIVQEIVADFQALVPLVLPFFPSAAPVIGIVDAALALLPALLQGVGLTAPAPTAAFAPGAIVPSAQQARLVLAKVHTRTPDHA